ncbi:family 43 glycoside hydrolase [Cryphonectria parasitica EP155]|uniref:Family 43 glycoside hydrolase n=1 Tax=Cryphonectria parasitica (strain ATCC 38755 / EP155) TaxID=660469 RepID=A0A9P5CK64_CRYP1|nr:family 43 glycoside hydrolase [Cryphonectria parasitica EP155]KAF3761733.1 family 43 glycoside hydrolase [Cryphonectria parasitica EP155]
MEGCYGSIALGWRADSSLTGYLGAFFLGDDPYVYFYLSQDNNAVSLSALNGGNPILVPTLGTGGVRDPAIVSGGGDEAGNKWYIVGTDLDISKTTWDASERTGSRGIFVWESTNLVDWTNERLVTVEDETAGMVWAPEAVWDPSKGQYLTHWASKFYDESDTNHTGNATNIMIRYSYTSDFQTFTAPQTYIDYSPTDIIDLTILPYPDSSDTFLRFLKDETLKDVFVEYSTTGLFGTWTRPGGSSAYIRAETEGPAAYWDNVASGEVHLLVDYYGGNGYFPLVSSDPMSNSGWANSSTVDFPTGLRHGSVLPINETIVGALSAAWQ